MPSVSFRLCVIAVPLNLVLLAVAVQAQTSDVQQHLRNQYENKIFLLRGFYSDDQLRYDATGAPIGTPSPGFWTIDGFVLVTDAKAHGQSLVLKGRRMPVISVGQGFQFQADSPKKRKKTPSFEIEAKLGPGSPVEEADAVAAKIFLTERDSLVAILPVYWQTCMSAGLNELIDPKSPCCRFSAELLAIPGVNSHADLGSNPEKGQTTLPESQMVHVFRIGKDISPPRMVFAPQPQYSDLAKHTSLQGVVTLGVIVDDQGVPRNVHILSPLGAGLDEQAVAAIRTWRFKPAEQEGHGPVAVEIAVEVDFHLY
jgi:TonB family protein